MTRLRPWFAVAALGAFVWSCGGDGAAPAGDADATDATSDAADAPEPDAEGDAPDGGAAADADDDASDEAADVAETDEADAAPDAVERPVIADWPAPDCRRNAAPFPERPAVDEAATLPWLRVEATDIVDEEGTPVALRGVNFGSWLLIENWMVGLGEIDEEEFLEEFDAEAARLELGELLADARASNAIAWLVTQRAHRTLVNEWKQFMFREAADAQLDAVASLWAWFDAHGWVFEEASLWSFMAQRFGAEDAERLRVAWGRNFITERDFEIAADLGFNAIRLPLNADVLEDATPAGVVWRQEGWDRLADALLWARRHGLYVIVDLHGAPGGQSAEWHTGRTNGGALFTSDACLDRTVTLWRALAAFVDGDPHAAILDLLNEPSGSPNRDGWVRVHQALYDAVRAENARAIVMAEDGYRAQRQIAGPAELGWENAMFSLHFYPENSTPAGYEISLTNSLGDWAGIWPERFACPVLLGEFNAEMDAPDGFEAMDRALALFNARGVHWTFWTWKFWSPSSVWGVLTPAGGARRIPLREASFDDILADVEATRSDGYVVDPRYEAVLQARAADPVAPLAMAGAE